MTRGIYISATTPGSGKTLVSLGLADALHRHADRIGFFRPITAGAEPDPTVAMLRRIYRLDAGVCRSGMSGAEARALLAAGERAEIDARCVEIYSDIAKKCDVVIVEGTDLTGQDAAVEFDLNARLSNNLGLPVLAVVGARGLTVEETADAVDVARKELVAANCSLLAMMVNRAEPGEAAAIKAAVRPGASSRPVYVIPEIPEISLPTVGEVAAALQLRQIAGSPEMDRDVRAIKVAAMTVGNFLHLLEANDLVIVPGDRADVMVASLASAFSPEFPVPGGMILTGGLAPDPNVLPILAHAPFPVFTYDDDTYSSARAVSEVRSEIHSGQRRKVAAAMGAWSRSVDEAELLERVSLPRPATMTPLRFLHELVERARSDRKRIVLPEGNDPRLLQAAEILQRRDVCGLVLLGRPQAVRELAAAHGVDLEGVEIIDPESSPLRESFAVEYQRLRAHKGVDLARAREVMADGSYFGTMMVQLGHVDGMVSGAAHTTANTIRPALEFVKTRPGVSIVSSVFLMLLADRVLVYGDCAVNPEPNEEQLADIAVASAETALQFGVEPRIAMLSYSTGGSGSGSAVDQVRRATALARAARPDLAIEGPIQYDAAVDASIAASKLPASEVAGQATVFVFPDLNTGNNTYKAVQQSSGAVAVGPVLQGLNKPINDLSRGCTVEDIVNTVAITAIQAQGAPVVEPGETKAPASPAGRAPSSETKES
ncbi:phosphate acetyltransferase [Arthrobacter sp. STN4]|uniref:phosphate acetyltransferase n=1 Tax=Arthrobacter sp. STN4 TaxID=2923276 RepID=UPI002119E49E|nr:phosphate acetyltransferase [Arthrobacter sp. STN4]MCQ9165106.1 phosphate acetyltransferase [Arthrobacter sp. STN4]